MRPYSNYKDSGSNWIGRVPGTWNSTKVKYVSENLDCMRIPVRSDERDNKQGIYPYYGATGIIDYVDDYIFDGEFLLVGEDGAPFFLREDVAFIASGKFWVNNHAHILKAKKGLDIRYLKYALNCVDYSEYVSGSTREKLPQSDLAGILIPFPSEPEMQAIANYLDRKTAQIDTLIAKKQRQIELLQEQRRATINQAVTKGLAPSVPMKDSGIDWMGFIPQIWKLTKVKYVSENFDYMRIPVRADERDSRKGVYPYYGANGIIDYVDDYLFEGEYLLVGEDGAPFLLSEDVAFIANGKFWVNNHAHILKTKKGFDIRFLKYALNSVDYSEYISGSTREKLPQSDLARIVIPFPLEKEQRAIADFLDWETALVEILIAKIQATIAYFQEYRTSLISAVVTGKLDVRGGT